MRLSEAFQYYERDKIRMAGLSDKSAKNYRSAYRSFEKCLGDIQVEHLMLHHIHRWQEYRGNLGASDSTVNHDLGRLRKVLKFLRKRGYNVIDDEEIELPKIRPKTYTWLEYREVQQLIDVIERPRDKAIVACLFSTGCRISELLNLNREDIRGNSAQVIGKGDKIGTVYFDENALKYLHAYLATRKDMLRPLFISGQRRRITPSTVGRLLHEYTDMAGINKIVTPHVLRHSFATDLKLNGADIYDIKELLRHEKISSTVIYTHINDKQKKRIHEQYHSH